MAEFICRLGTPAGEVITRTVEAPGVIEARAHLEREGFRVFNVTPPKTSGVAALTRFGREGVGSTDCGCVGHGVLSRSVNQHRPPAREVPMERQRMFHPPLTAL